MVIAFEYAWQNSLYSYQLGPWQPWEREMGLSGDPESQRAWVVVTSEEPVAHQECKAWRLGGRPGQDWNETFSSRESSVKLTLRIKEKLLEEPWQMNDPEQFQLEPRRVDLEIKEPGCKIFREAQEDVPEEAWWCLLTRRGRNRGELGKNYSLSTGMEPKRPCSLLSTGKAGWSVTRTWFLSQNGPLSDLGFATCQLLNTQ